MNASAISSSKSVEKENLKNIQLDFLRWAVKWINNEGKQIEEMNHDYGDIVILLQALGYQIRLIDSCDPQEVTPLAGGERGSRIVVSCCHSGQRCMLEHPQPQDSCRCNKLNDESKESFWEVTAVSNNTSRNSCSVIESGSDLIPTIPKEVSVLMKSTLNYFFSLCREKETSRRGSLASGTSSSSPKQNAKRLSAYMREVDRDMNTTVDKTPTPAVPVSDEPDNALRYGSLDTLLMHQIEEAKISTTNLLVQEPNRIKSSPSIMSQKRGRHDVRTSPGIIGADPERLISVLCDANVSIQSALEMLGSNKFREVMQQARDQKLGKQNGSTIPKRHQLTPKMTSRLPSAPTVTANVPGTSRSNTISGTSKSVPNSANTKHPTVNRNNLYAHVKSTIPKGNVIKRKPN